ncbi:hypothetical protein Lal_00036864 [Lupinus albus]|nr:hypothetical protein Lal_00036864 [Lupinus albus]
MQFTAGTTLKQREFPDILELEYDFKKFSDIISGNFRSDLLIDVIGVFYKLIFSQTQSNLKKVIFSMKDFCGDVISCTLWEAHAIKFLNYYNNQPSLHRILPERELSRLGEKWHFGDVETDMTCVTVGTTTMFVVGRQGWYYDGCGKCTKKADVKDGPFTCKCGHFNQISIPRYKLEIKINHEHSCGRFKGEDDPKAFPLVLDELLARTMVLRVKVQPSYNQSSVIRLSEDPNLIKNVVDQIGVFEPKTSADLKGKSVCSDFVALESSVSMTAEHDPEQFQVVTPAKRLSAEFDLDLLESPHYNSTQFSTSKMSKNKKTE